MRNIPTINTIEKEQMMAVESGEGGGAKGLDGFLVFALVSTLCEEGGEGMERKQ